MNVSFILTSVLSLLAGIGVFLVACRMMSTNIESASGPGLRKLFFKAYDNRLLGIFIGTAVTAIIQSSGATSVMTIGFVNAGIMTIKQAASIIYGAFVGTTVTGQIVALGMYGTSSISTSVIFSGLAGIGAFISSFTKKDSVKKWSGILTGFGLLFVGLSMMSSSMKQFAELESVKLFLSSITNPALLILVGLILAAIVQSSSVVSSIAITMLYSSLIDLNQGIYIVVGSNIGACIVPFMAALTGNENSKKTACIAILFNVIGALAFLIVDTIVRALSGLGTSDLFAWLFPGAVQTQLAMFHTAFNLAKVLIALPLTKIILAVADSLYPQKEDIGDKGPHFYFLDNGLLSTPSLAARQVKNEILHMGELAMENFNLSLDIICNNDASQIENFNKREEEIDFLNREITHFVVDLLKFKHSEYDRKYLSTTFKTCADFERIGDYAENITEYQQSLYDNGVSFSKTAVEEINQVREKINTVAQLTFEAYRHKDWNSYLKAKDIEEEVDDLTDNMQVQHIERLNHGFCTALAGVHYLSLAENAERVSDHLINVGQSIKELK